MRIFNTSRADMLPLTSHRPRNRKPYVALAVVGILGILSLLLLNISTLSLKSDTSILSQSAIPLSVAGLPGFRLFAHQRKSHNDGIVELIIDEDNFAAFQEHFRSLRAGGHSSVFLDSRTSSNAAQNVAVAPSKQFLEALGSAKRIFNGTDIFIKQELEYKYIAYEKELPYVGNPSYVNLFDPEIDRQKYLNSFAVFPSHEDLHLPPAESHRFHGAIGWTKNGTQIWTTLPMPPLLGNPAVNMTEELKRGGGFYKNLSDALPMDRDVLESRDGFCLNEVFDLKSLDDASIIITFYNEHISALLRSIHSILNRTPPPLLREIILVDDHSNHTDLAPGGFIYDLIATLPKVKLIRMPERRGIVMARLAGAKLATAPVLVILDSHIEVNQGWLEPQLRRLKESPRSLVMPQIDVIDPEFFNFTKDAGIGCWLGFKWVIQEQASLTLPISNSHPIPSPSMAGGLFAIRADWFWELGGYDEGFEMWGAENIEMGFRVWMCGGRIECAPCARVYHIYRKGGSGYPLPPLSLAKNRLRTARVWMDEYSKLAEMFIHAPKADMGNIDRMLDLKERLNCRNFSWYLNNVDPTNEIHNFADIIAAGEIRNVHHNSVCVDTLSKAHAGEQWGAFGCHGVGGTQGFLITKGGRIVLFLHDRLCLGGDLKIQECEFILKDHGRFVIQKMSTGDKIEWHPVKSLPVTCLTMKEDAKVTFEPCKDDNSTDPKLLSQQRWTTGSFLTELSNYAPPAFSAEYVERKKKADSIFKKTLDETIWKYGEKSDGSQVDQYVVADP